MNQSLLPKNKGNEVEIDDSVLEFFLQGQIDLESMVFIITMEKYNPNFKKIVSDWK